MGDRPINPERSLHELANTDESYAKAKALVKYLEHKGKTIKATEYLKASGTVGERESEAYTSKAYKAFSEELKNAVYDEQILAAKRKTAELAIEVWRSQNANQRRGNV
jgi:hypothetical protein